MFSDRSERRRRDPTPEDICGQLRSAGGAAMGTSGTGAQGDNTASTNDIQVFLFFKFLLLGLQSYTIYYRFSLHSNWCS